MGQQSLVRKVLQIDGMTCTGCEVRIENTLRKIEGVAEVKAIFNSSNVYITYDSKLVPIGRLIEAIERLDYRVKNIPKADNSSKNPAAQENERKGKMQTSKFFGVAIILFAVYLIVENTLGFNNLIYKIDEYSTGLVPDIDQSMSYSILFFVGLLTSLHCIAMCGGINLSQCTAFNPHEAAGIFAKIKPSILYNAGRVLSYTAIGGVVGAIGRAMSFSGTAKGIVAILAGVFMIIMGLNMLNVFPWLRRLNPRMPKAIGNKLQSNQGQYGPLYVGMLNGLMPCGPLQAMQIYALGTGSPLAGALSMFLFSLGTVPFMLGFGVLGSLLKSKFTHRMMKVSAALVLILGILMINRGMNLSGVSLMAGARPEGTGNVAHIEKDGQTVTTRLESGRYSPIVVQKGIPVKWIIKAEKKDLNGCNNPITIPQYGIQKKLEPGDNIIEFTPQQEGNIRYTCWMGMISSSIKVVSDADESQGTVSDSP